MNEGVKVFYECRCLFLLFSFYFPCRCQDSWGAGASTQFGIWSPLPPVPPAFTDTHFKIACWHLFIRPIYERLHGGFKIPCSLHKNLSCSQLPRSFFLSSPDEFPIRTARLFFAIFGANLGHRAGIFFPFFKVF